MKSRILISVALLAAFILGLLTVRPIARAAEIFATTTCAKVGACVAGKNTSNGPGVLGYVRARVRRFRANESPEQHRIELRRGRTRTGFVLERQVQRRAVRLLEARRRHLGHEHQLGRRLRLIEQVHRRFRHGLGRRRRRPASTASTTTQQYQRCGRCRPDEGGNRRDRLDAFVEQHQHGDAWRRLPMEARFCSLASALRTMKSCRWTTRATSASRSDLHQRLVRQRLRSPSRGRSLVRHLGGDADARGYRRSAAHRRTPRTFGSTPRSITRPIRASATTC